MIFIKYDIILRKKEPIFTHFEDVAKLLESKFREYEKGYRLIFYDAAVVSHELSKRVDRGNYSSLAMIFEWHLVPGEKRGGVHPVYEARVKDVRRLLKDFSRELGALHLDIITPYPFKDVGTLITDYGDRLVGMFEFDIFDSFDVVPNINKEVDRKLINLIRKKFSCLSCKRDICIDCDQSISITRSTKSPERLS